MRQLLRIESLLLVALVATGCGNGENNATDPEPVVDLDAAVDAIATKQCEKILECCADDELSDLFGNAETTDVTGCEEQVRAQAQAFFQPAVEEAISDERARLSQAGLDDCLAALDSRVCGEFQPSITANVAEVPGCEDFVEPLLATSGFCNEDFECQTGFCSVTPGEAEGSCKNPPALDEPCLNDRCGAGLYCSMEGTMDNTCAEKLGLGAVCTRNADCESEVCGPTEDGDFVCQTLNAICSGS